MGFHFLFKTSDAEAPVQDIGARHSGHKMTLDSVRSEARSSVSRVDDGDNSDDEDARRARQRAKFKSASQVSLESGAGVPPSRRDDANGPSVVLHPAPFPTGSAHSDVGPRSASPSSEQGTQTDAERRRTIDAERRAQGATPPNRGTKGVATVYPTLQDLRTLDSIR